jgi:hypothetical protein
MVEAKGLLIPEFFAVSGFSRNSTSGLLLALSKSEIISHAATGSRHYRSWPNRNGLRH